MIDIKRLREDPDGVRIALTRKKFTFELDAVLELDAVRRTKIVAAEQAKAEQNSANKAMAAMAKGSAEFLQKVAEMKAVSACVKELEAQCREAETAFYNAFLTLPNLPDPSVPDGRVKADNVVVAEWGERLPKAEHRVPHWDIPWFSRAIDFERGVKATGAGFPFYVGDMARLVRALIHLFLETARRNGYEEVLPPILVNEVSATATGQLPDKEGQMYADPNEGLYLIPTAEVPVTNFYRDEILPAEALPICRCAYSPCFRREAGSWGSHVRGLNRLHQFDKVELVKWTDDESSFAELESLRADVEGILQALELPYRVLLMCAGDIGFPHAKQYDLEVHAAGQDRWLEVSSCSNFTDFQARRAGIRYRDADGKTRVAHTLNGSGLAIPRVLAALLENNLQADNSVRLPKVLQDFMGQDSIRF